ncbi:MAG: DNA repair protein RecO [Bacteroidia bacterium]
MILSTPAVVLHTIPYGDTSVIAQVYSRDRGLLGIIVKGVRGGKKNRKSALFQALTILEIQINLKENKDLHYLRDMRVLHPYTGIPFSTPKTAQALFIAELLKKSIREEEKNEALFEYIVDALQFLDEMPEVIPHFHHKFLLELSRHLGFYPEDNYDEQHPFFQFTDGVFHHSFGDTCVDMGPSFDIQQLLKVNFANLDKIQMGRERRKALLRNLLQYYRWHLPSFKELQTPDVLEAVFG